MDSPKISVIVVAHDRRKFILEAVKSVLGQDMPRSSYEIVVVKNYRDEQIDSFLDQNNVKIVFDDKQPYGHKIATGLSNSTGEIICFLEDDDVYEPTKLKSVLNAYDHENVIFYKTCLSSVNESGKPIKGVEQFSCQIDDVLRITLPMSNSDIKKIITLGLEPYISTVTLRRSCIQSELQRLSELKDAVDTFVFYSVASLSKGIMVFDPSRLTRYRVHESTSHHFSNDYSVYRDQKVKQLSSALESWKIIRDMTSSKKSSSLERAAMCANYGDRVLYNLLSRSDRISVTDQFRILRCSFIQNRSLFLNISFVLLLSRFSRRWALRMEYNISKGKLKKTLLETDR